MIKSVYGLCYQDPIRGPVVFYVGCTNDVARRTGEHKRFHKDEKHPEYDTYKYQFCRHLASQGIDFSLEVLAPAEEVNDEADEYIWILKFARHNEDNDIGFYDNMPLTNMKAGDFLEEMLRDKTVTTAVQVRSFVKRKREQRVSSYQRNNANTSVFNLAGRQVVAQMNAYAEEQRHKRLIAEEKKRRRAERVAREKAEWLAEQEAIWNAEKIEFRKR